MAAHGNWIFVQLFPVMQFWQKLWQIIGQRSPPWGWRPSGKSWIRHCKIGQIEGISTPSVKRQRQSQAPGSFNAGIW